MLHSVRNIQSLISATTIKD